MARALKNVSSISLPVASPEQITPSMAEAWLGKNKVNRPIRDRKVTQFTRDMVNGNWRLTGEGIKFGQSGNLLDGQNRLWAIIESGCTVTMFVVRGLEDDTQSVMDSGTARTASDNLGMAGYKNSAILAAIARRRITTTAFNDVTNTEVNQFVDANSADAMEATEIARKYAKRTDITPSTVGLAAWRIAEVHDWYTADEFFSAASEKVGLSPGDPVLAMTAFFADSKLKRRKLDLRTQLSVIIRAFNARNEGKTMRVVRVVSARGGVVPIPPVSPR